VDSYVGVIPTARSCSRSSSRPMLTWARLLSVPMRRVTFVPVRRGEEVAKQRSENIHVRFVRMNRGLE